MAQIPSGNQSSEAVSENSVGTRNNAPDYRRSEDRLKLIEHAVMAMSPVVLTYVERKQRKPTIWR